MPQLRLAPLLTVFCALLSASIAHAQNEPLLISNSRSPSGKLELWISPISSVGIAAGTAQIRTIKTGKILGTFYWSGFGEHADNTAFAVIWRPDNKYFAIKWEQDRGWVTGAIYGQYKDSTWHEVKTPSDKYIDAIMKMGDVTDLYGKGCDSPVEWLKNGDLTLLFIDRNLSYDHEDFEKEFVITLSPSDKKGRPLPIATLVSVRQKSEQEVKQDLRTENN